jgi:hypothetical protein
MNKLTKGCPYCGRLIEDNWTSCTRWRCTNKSLNDHWAQIKRDKKLRKKAGQDALRIQARERDFATYTNSLLDMHAQRAREEIR